MSPTEIQPATEQKPIAKVDTLDFKAIQALGSDPASRHNIQTNFTGRGMAAAAFVTQALAKPGLKFDDLGPNVFRAKYYLAHVAEVVTTTGEVIQTPRLVLLGANGEVMAGVSEGAVASLDLIRSLCGEGPWDPPIPISVVVVRTRQGFRTFRLVVGDFSNEPVGQEVSDIGRQPQGQPHSDGQAKSGKSNASSRRAT